MILSRSKQSRRSCRPLVDASAKKISAERPGLVDQTDEDEDDVRTIPRRADAARQRRSEWNRILETYTLFGGVRERHNFNSYRLRDRDRARSRDLLGDLTDGPRCPDRHRALSERSGIVAFDPVLYLAQAINDAVKDRHGHAWILYKERLEVSGLDDERLDRFDGRHARRPACPAQ